MRLFLNDIVHETEIDDEYDYSQKEVISLFESMSNYNDNFFGLIMRDEQIVQFAWESDVEAWLLDIPLRSTFENKNGHTSLQKYCNKTEVIEIIKTCFAKESISFLRKVESMNETLEEIEDRGEYTMNLSAFEDIRLMKRNNGKSNF